MNNFKQIKFLNFLDAKNININYIKKTILFNNKNNF